MLTEPLLDRLAEKETEVKVMRVKKLDLSEVSGRVLFRLLSFRSSLLTVSRTHPLIISSFCLVPNQHCDLFVSFSIPLFPSLFAFAFLKPLPFLLHFVSAFVHQFLGCRSRRMVLLRHHGGYRIHENQVPRGGGARGGTGSTAAGAGGDVD